MIRITKDGTCKRLTKGDGNMDERQVLMTEIRFHFNEIGKFTSAYGKMPLNSEQEEFYSELQDLQELQNDRNYQEVLTKLDIAGLKEFRDMVRGLSSQIDGKRPTVESSSNRTIRNYNAREDLPQNQHTEHGGKSDVVAIYSKSKNTFNVQVQIKILGYGNKGWSTESYNASGRVQNRSQSGPVYGTSPRGNDIGTPKQYYIPESLPNGTYKLGAPIRFNERDPEYSSLGPAFVPIQTTLDVPVYGTTQPVRNPETGLFEPTSVQTDGGYGVHTNMTRGNTTWGCVGILGENKLEDAIKFASAVENAHRSGGTAKLIITD